MRLCRLDDISHIFFIIIFIIIMIVNLKSYFCFYFWRSFALFCYFLDDIINIPQKCHRKRPRSSADNLSIPIPLNFISHHHRRKFVYVNAIKIIHQLRQIVKFTSHPTKWKMRQSKQNFMGERMKINKKSIKVRWKSFFIVKSQQYFQHKYQQTRWTHAIV